MVEAFFRVLALIRKELIAILKDPRSRRIVLLPPIVQCFLFGYAASYDLNEVRYAVLDQDHSAASQELLADFSGSGVFRQIAALQSTRELDQFITDQRALVVLQIPQDFERTLFGKQNAALQLIVDGRNSNTANVAAAYAQEIVDGFNSKWRSAHGQTETKIKLLTRGWYNPNFETRWNMIPALVGTLTLLSTLLLTAMSVAREREQGTFDQLLVTPFQPAEIMVGKAVPSVLVGLVQATAILLIGQLWFKIPFAGSFVTLYFGLTVFLMAAVGLGLFVSSFSGTMQQAMLYSFVVIMPCTLLSGLTTPISNMPEILQVATALNPLRYAIDIAKRVYLEGAGIELLLPEIYPLALIGIVTLSCSAWLFRHKLI